MNIIRFIVPNLEAALPQIVEHARLWEAYDLPDGGALVAVIPSHSSVRGHLTRAQFEILDHPHSHKPLGDRAKRFQHLKLKDGATHYDLMQAIYNECPMGLLHPDA